MLGTASMMAGDSYGDRQRFLDQPSFALKAGGVTIQHFTIPQFAHHCLYLAKRFRDQSDQFPEARAALRRNMRNQALCWKDLKRRGVI